MNKTIACFDLLTPMPVAMIMMFGAMIAAGDSHSLYNGAIAASLIGIAALLFCGYVYFKNGLVNLTEDIAVRRAVAAKNAWMIFWISVAALIPVIARETTLVVAHLIVISYIGAAAATAFLISKAFVQPDPFPVWPLMKAVLILSVPASLEYGWRGHDGWMLLFASFTFAYMMFALPQLVQRYPSSEAKSS